MLKNGMKNSTFIYLSIGFFTCGFHMVLITNHLPTEFATYGFSPEVIAYAFSIYGVATIIGSIIIGGLCSKYNKRNILACLYGSRPLMVLFFLLMPKTLLTLCVFIILLGFTGSSTVPPVTGLLGDAFGVKRLGMLFGLVFLVHQIGGFLGAWIGGTYFDMTGNYTLIWITAVILSVVASFVTLKIKNIEN